jgi:calcium-dependent protein kinase
MFIAKLLIDTLAEVRLCVHKTTKLERAVKIYPKAMLKDENAKSRFVAEIETQKKLDHPNIVKLFEAFEDAQNIYLVEE